MTSTPFDSLFRKCKVCKEDKAITLFGVYKIKTRERPTRRRTCNNCRVDYQKEKYKNNPELKIKAKAAAKRSILKNQYKISISEYEKLVSKQSGKCAICFVKSKKTLNIDHCHQTGKVRGLLCWNCNIGIGYLKHKKEILSKAIEYLS